MNTTPKSAPQNAPQNAPRPTRGEHGLWYIPGTPYTYTRDRDGNFYIYAPGCQIDGLPAPAP